MSDFFLQFFFIFFSFFGQSGEASQWRVGYQRGLPRLVFRLLCLVKLYADLVSHSPIFCARPKFQVHKMHWQQNFLIASEIVGNVKKSMALNQIIVRHLLWAASEAFNPIDLA